MEDMDYYVLFSNHDNGMRLYRALKSRGLRSVIAPTPRQLSTCCGISLKIEQEEKDQVADCAREENIPILGIEGLERHLRSDRDRYC